MYWVILAVWGGIERKKAFGWGAQTVSEVRKLSILLPSSSSFNRNGNRLGVYAGKPWKKWKSGSGITTPKRIKESAARWSIQDRSHDEFLRSAVRAGSASILTTPKNKFDHIYVVGLKYAQKYPLLQLMMYSIWPRCIFSWDVKVFCASFNPTRGGCEHFWKSHSQSSLSVIQLRNHVTKLLPMLILISITHTAFFRRIMTKNPVVHPPLNDCRDDSELIATRAATTTNMFSNNDE